MLDVELRHRQGDFTIDVAFASQGAGVTALFGRSGSGKTSVVAMVAGLRRPDEGRILLDGTPLFDRARGVDLPPERRRVGYVFQESRLFPHMSVRSNLTYGMKRVPAAERYVQFDPVVELLGIGPLLDRRPGSLSGGEKQRVAIGRALLTSPRLLLMDEPLASLDAARKAEVLPFVARLPREFAIPILYVSHSLDEVLKLADQLVLMEHGRAAAVGTVEDLMSRPELAAITGQSEAAAVLQATVAGHDDALGLTFLDLPAGRLRLAHLDQPPGSRVRLRILSSDVAIARGKPAGLSIQNALPATIVELREAGQGYVDLRLDVGGPLWARVTRSAVRDLGLVPGLPVHALLKAVSVTADNVGSRLA